MSKLAHICFTSHVTYLCANFSLGLYALDLGPMYATDVRQTSDV